MCTQLMNKVGSRRLGAVHVLNDVITLHTQQILAMCKQTPTQSCVTCIAVCCDNNNNNQNECQPGLRACGASLSSPGRLVLSNFMRVKNRQTMHVGQNHIVCCKCHQRGSWSSNLGFSCRAVMMRVSPQSMPCPLLQYNAA